MSAINKKNSLNYQKKDRVKVVRVILQIFILAALGMVFFKTVFYTAKFKEPDRSLWTGHDGFVALAFPRVSMTEQPERITKSQLDEYLGVLHLEGYTTISQQDIVDYYLNSKPLPKKAVFLLFEGEGKDSVQFTNPLLEKYNYKATILTYANILELSNQLFIQPQDILNMKKTGFWEVGTNGYRLAYINVFDRDSNFFPMLGHDEFANRDGAKSYNHYIMDFIRNKDMIPVETKKEMAERINFDYEKMKEVYAKTLGFVPDLYVIMHSNSPYFGTNKLVGEVNAANIRRMFKLNFNREGSCYNTRADSIYDLTRLQVQPYWHINHLLMKIKEDTNHNVEFITGDKRRAGKWDVIDGAAEFDGNRIILTSSYKGAGMMSLKGSGTFSDLKLGVAVPENIPGKQSIYLRHDSRKNSYICVTLHDNNITVEQKTPGSIEAKHVFKRELDASADDTRKIELVLNGGTLTVAVDGKELSECIKVDSSIAGGGISLSSMCGGENGNDKIYDAVFDDFFILNVSSDGSTKQEVLYDNRYSTFEKTVNLIKKVCGYLINWFIENL